jgi:hypothetical protein
VEKISPLPRTPGAIVSTLCAVVSCSFSSPSRNLPAVSLIGRVEDKTYQLRQDDTILFDGLLDHSYTQIEAGDYLTVHIPKDVRVIENLLDSKSEEAAAQ